MFYPTREAALGLERAQGMSSVRPEPHSATGGLLEGGLASATTNMIANANMTNIEDMPTMTNDIHDHHQHQNMGTGNQSMQTLPCFNDLIAVLIECFALIAIGYFSGRFKLISSDSKDIGVYLTTFALPMIIFLNVAQMEIQTINLSFLACMLASKLLLFVLVTLITLAISYPSNFSYAGALSILATQSNDFALGYPLFKSLYGESKPEMLSYLNLMGPIQLLIINPLGIVMLEFEKSRTNRALKRRRNSMLAQKRCLHCLDALRRSPTPPAPPTSPIPIASPKDRSQGRSQPQLTGQFSSSNKSAEIKSKNIKSLALVMPARVLPERVASGESSDELVDCYRQAADATDSQTHPSAPQAQAGLDSSLDSVNLALTRHRNLGLEIMPTKPKMLGQIIGHHGTGMGSASPEPTLSALGVHVADSASKKCSCGHNGASVDETQEREPVIDLGFVKALLTNPLIIASVVALAVNLIHGPELPKFVTKVSNTIAASFAAPALFVVGLSMYGKFKLILRNPNDLLLSSVLVLTKVFILPNLMRTIVLMVLPHYTDAEEIPYLADFAFLYGLLPTAPGACIIAKQYEVLTNVVSICMLLSTFISAPMMLGTSAIISQVSATAPGTTLNILAQTLRISGSVTLTLSMLTLYMLWKSNRRIMNSLDRIMSNVAELKATHVFTFLLTLTQLLVGFGGCLWLFVDMSKLKQQSFLEPMTSEDDSHWPRGDTDELFNEEGKIHALDTTSSETRASAIAPYPQTIGFGELCAMKYVLASGGILMARFIILCVVITNFARHFRGHQMAVQVSSLMLKVYPIFGFGVILCLVFESHHLSCMPSESSLPTWTFSSYVRLTFNAILLLLAVPLFAATFRLTNKAAWLGSKSLSGPGPSTNGRLGKRKFVTSSVSLSSDTSSAITTSTNLEATLNGGINQHLHNAQNASQASGHESQQHQSNVSPDADSTVLLVDYDVNPNQQGNLDSEVPKNVFSSNHGVPNKNHSTFSKGTTLVDSAYGDAKLKEEKQRISMAQCDINNNYNDNKSHNNYGELSKQIENNNQTSKVRESDNTSGAISTRDIPQQTEQMTTANIETKASATKQVSATTASNHAHEDWPPVNEFSRYSILIVFMLFQTLISLTSLIQLLNQVKPSGGTSVMGEITNVALDFGQGIVTFLVIGSQSYLKDLISSLGLSSSATRQRVESQA